VPEVIDEGVTGFIVDDEDEAIAAIKRIGELNRRRVRATFERRFTAKRMAEDYLRHYQSLLQAETVQALEPARMLNAV
jgi:glycosyltransferase involved in cell wall biosynthesis